MKACCAHNFPTITPLTASTSSQPENHHWEIPSSVTPAMLGPTHVMGPEEMTFIIFGLMARVEALEQCRARIEKGGGENGG